MNDEEPVEDVPVQYKEDDELKDLFTKERVGRPVEIGMRRLDEIAAGVYDSDPRSKRTIEDPTI